MQTLKRVLAEAILVYVFTLAGKGIHEIFLRSTAHVRTRLAQQH